MKKVSVVIPVYNRLNIFSKCLESLFRQEYENMEVIVIDDNSTEPISEFVKSKYPQIKLIRNKKNRNPTFARNQGILISSGEYVLFLDSDTEFIRKDTISNSVKILEANPEIGAVGGEIPIYEKNNATFVCGHKFFFQKDRVIDVLEPTDERTARKEVDVIKTSNLMSRRKTLVEIGGFDSSFCPHEDSDLCWRFKKKGYRTIIDFYSGVIHKKSEEATVKRIRSDYSIMKSRIQYQLKHFGFLHTGWINCWYEPIFSFPVRSFFSFVKRISKGQRKEEAYRLAGVRGKKYFYWLWCLFWAICWNLLHLKKILKSRNKNFLKGQELLNSVQGCGE